MSNFIALVRRDIGRMLRGGVLLPVGFFLLVATLFPFAIGPDRLLLARTGGGVLWVAALLAALLPVDRLLRADADAGVLDQLAVRGIADESVAAARLVAHWLCFALPLLAALPAAAALLGLDAATLARLALGLAIGTPALAGLALVTAALTVSLRGGSAVTGLVLLPLAVPVLIFGGGLLAAPGGGTGGNAGALKLLSAVSLVLTALAPLAAGAALRAARD